MEFALELGGSGTTDDGHLVNKPNIFDVSAQETTKSLLKPLFQQAYQFLSTQFPGNLRLARLSEKLEGIFLLVDIVIEGMSLKRASGTICETYYGMRRDGASGSLSKVQLLVSIFECVIPHILAQLKAYLASLRTRIRRTRPEMWAIYGLPILGGVYHASNLILKLLYMYTKIASPSICMLLAGIGYKRQQNSEQSTFLTPLATLIYILRFMQWWQEEGQQALKRNQEIPTAPTDFPNHHPSSGLVDVPGKCPICWDIPKKPVSLTSGRVFCEKCLLLNKVYTEERCCPVSLDQVKQYLPLFVDSTH